MTTLLQCLALAHGPLRRLLRRAPSRRSCLATCLAALLATLGPAAHAQVIDGSLESGNIADLTQVGPDAYEMSIRPDTGSDDQQWFYFTVADAGGRTLSFELDGLDYSAPWVAGMTPCVSDDPADPDSWTRIAPQDCVYNSWTISFSYSFPDNGTYHFAYSFVYPVSRADALVDELEASPFVERRVLTQSLQGRDIDLLEITEGDAADKLGVWIQARQHPAECGSSWTCEALLRWLIGPSEEARAVRQGAVLRVVPMMNPDGVALGNYRRNSLGLDLNREWGAADPLTTPSVAAAQADMAQFDATQGLDMFLDLHTHSSELKNWVYGVDGSAQFDALERGWAEELEVTNPDFSYPLSSFSNGDAGVAKNRVHDLHPASLSYTHEQTYHTIPYGPHADQPVTVARYQAMGVAIGESLASFFELPMNPWVDVGQALAGTHGEPLATADGTLIAGTSIAFALSNARADSSAWFVLGLGVWNAPFKGGVLVPDLSPPGLFLSVQTGPQGALELVDSWPVGVPAGFDLAVQWWIADPAGPVGFAASNGLLAQTP